MANLMHVKSDVIAFAKLKAHGALCAAQETMLTTTASGALSLITDARVGRLQAGATIPSSGIAKRAICNILHTAEASIARLCSRGRGVILSFPTAVCRARLPSVWRPARHPRGAAIGQPGRRKDMRNCSICARVIFFRSNRWQKVHVTHCFRAASSTELSVQH